MKEYEKHYQVGNIIRIRKEPLRPNLSGFYLNTEHAIQTPPNGKLNTGLGVWVKNNQNKIRLLRYQYWIWTGKTTQIKRVRKNVIT